MRIAAYQCQALNGDIEANLTRLEVVAKSASVFGADLLVLPEMYLTGYALGDRVAEFAFGADAPALDQVARIARRYGIALSLGYPEKREGKIWNSAALWDKSGQIAGQYCKTHLFGSEEKRLFATGESIQAFDWFGQKCGMLICYDVEFPEPVRSLASQGARLILAPTANMLPYNAVPHILIPARAMENGLSLVYVNYVGRERDLTYTGLSVIVGWDGEELARAGANGEALLMTDIPGWPGQASEQLKIE